MAKLKKIILFLLIIYLLNISIIALGTIKYYNAIYSIISEKSLSEDHYLDLILSNFTNLNNNNEFKLSEDDLLKLVSFLLNTLEDVSNKGVLNFLVKNLYKTKIDTFFLNKFIFEDFYLEKKFIITYEYDYRLMFWKITQVSIV